MFLTGHALAREVAQGALTIEPFDPAQLKPASYVLTLGRRFRRWKPLPGPIRLWSADAAREHLDEPGESDCLVLAPGEFALASTLERVALPAGLFGTISPLSHIARFGIGVTQGADFVNPGFGREIATALTLELSNQNVSPVELAAGIPIAHLRIGRVEGETENAPRERSIYEGADPLGPPKLFEEWQGSGLPRNG